MHAKLPAHPPVRLASSAGAVLHQEGKCEARTLLADGIAIALEHPVHRDHGLPTPGHTQVDRAHRFFATAAAGACNSGHRDSKIHTAKTQGTACHLLGYLRAHGTMNFQGLRSDLEQVDLGGVAVGDVAALKPVRAAGQRGHPLGKQPAGAGFCGGQAQSVFCHLLCERLQQGSDIG